MIARGALLGVVDADDYGPDGRERIGRDPVVDEVVVRGGRAGAYRVAVSMQRMDRAQFFGRLAGLDEERLKKALWNLYWRGSAAMRQRIEAELDPQPDRPKRQGQVPVVPGLVLDEVRDFVALARSGAYLGGDRRVSPRERTRWRFTFQRLVGDARAALLAGANPPAEGFADAAAAMELLIDLAREMRDREYFRSEDPVAAARFVVSDAVALLWSRLRDQYGFAGFVQRAAPQLIRWESRYGWTRHGDDSVCGREVALADVAAGALSALDAWIAFADGYLEALDQHAGGGGARAGRPLGLGDPTRDYARRRRAEDLAGWHHMLLDKLADGEAEDRLDRLVDHPALDGPEVVFLQARLAYRRGDVTQARELVGEGLQELPGHVALLEFAAELGSALPPRARQIAAQRARFPAIGERTDAGG